LRQPKTQRAFSLRLVNQSSAQRNNKAISHDQRAIDRGIPDHQIAIGPSIVFAGEARSSFSTERNRANYVKSGPGQYLAVRRRPELVGAVGSHLLRSRAFDILAALTERPSS
jgi:hypothetical protein